MESHNAQSKGRMPMCMLSCSFNPLQHKAGVGCLPAARAISQRFAWRTQSLLQKSAIFSLQTTGKHPVADPCFCKNTTAAPNSLAFAPKNGKAAATQDGVFPAHVNWPWWGLSLGLVLNAAQTLGPLLLCPPLPCPASCPWAVLTMAELFEGEDRGWGLCTPGGGGPVCGALSDSSPRLAEVQCREGVLAPTRLRATGQGMGLPQAKQDHTPAP